jgi:dephospho-CoA kinase
MKIIGLTGNIGSGKSQVASFLVESGAAYIDADKVTHEVYDPGTPGWQELIETFGKGILTPEGTIDRKKVSRIVFKNAEAIAKLNKILHPKIRAEIESRLKQLQEQGKKAAVVEAILLVEAGWMDMVDELWLITASRGITLERLKKRGLTESEALARLASQTPPEKLKSHARVVISNDGSLEDLRTRVEEQWKRLVNDG